MNQSGIRLATRLGDDKLKATMLGLLAILLWSTVVGLLRSISERLGPTGGAAMIYSVSALFLMPLVGLPRLRGLSPVYLCCAGSLFAAYEICLSLALGYATSRAQSVELGMINYLWPSFTVLLAIVMNGQKSVPGVYLGLLLSLLGIFWLMNGSGGWSPEHMLANIIANPLSYGLALAGAVIWALYCNVTRRFAGGQNGITLFFLLTASILWIKYAFSNEPAISFNTGSILLLLITGAVLGTAYASWNQGILKGNMTLLATCSYFTPILSSLFTSLLLGITLTTAFWQGVLMVCAGSIICWLSSRRS